MQGLECLGHGGARASLKRIDALLNLGSLAADVRSHVLSALIGGGFRK